MIDRPAFSRAGALALGVDLVRAWPSFLRDDGASTALRQPMLGTSHFRQASSVAFVLLLVTLGSITWGQSLLERLLINHVQEMVVAELRTQRELGDLNDSLALARTLRQRDTVLAQRQGRAIAVQASNGNTLHGLTELFSDHMCGARSAPCNGWQRARSDDGTREWLGLVQPLPDGGRYVVAYDIQPMQDRMYPVPLAVGAGVFFALLITLGIGLRVGVNKTHRVNQIRSAMMLFSRGDLEARVPVDLERQDEFDYLSNDINLALQRVSRLVEEVRHATNHIAHELRTPLARLQQRLDNIAVAGTDSATAASELAHAEKEAQRIQYLFHSVMRISEIETGRCVRESVSLDPQTLFGELRDYFEVAAEGCALLLHVRVDDGVTLVGDRALLFQALVNLVDNAIKYASADGHIDLVASCPETGWVELTVADQGPGIEASQRARAVQRFQRLTRDRSVPGHGLGLALVQAVAELHGGRLRLQDNTLRPSPMRGLMATLQLPCR